MTYVSDIEKLKEFMVSNNAEEVKALNDDDPVNLLIKAAYGFTDCEKLRRNKLAFNEKFLHLYAYLIVAVHRAIFEEGKCVKELLEIANYLEPYDDDSRKLRDFYNEVYVRVIKRSGNYVDNVYEVYNEFKNIGTDSLSSQVIRMSLGYMGVRGIVSGDELSDFFKPGIYVDFDHVSKEDAIKYLGYIPINDDVDGRTILNYYKGFARRIEGDITRINRETFSIKLLMIGLRLIKWLNTHSKEFKGLGYLQNNIEKRIRVVKNKIFIMKLETQSLFQY